jgi:hypothetical protein
LKNTWFYEVSTRWMLGQKLEKEALTNSLHTHLFIIHNHLPFHLTLHKPYSIIKWQDSTNHGGSITEWTTNIR